MLAVLPDGEVFADHCLRLTCRRSAAGDDGSYTGQSSRFCRGRQQSHVSKAKSKPPPQTKNRHSRAIQEAKESLEVVGLAVAREDMDALGDEVLEGYGTDFGLKTSILRVAAFLSAAEPVENACRRSCRIGFKYDQILDTMVGEPLAGTIGLNGDKALSNAVRAIMHPRQQKEKIYDDPEDDDDPKDPDQDVVVDGKLVAMPCARKCFRSRVAILVLAATGFQSSVSIASAQNARSTPNVCLPKRLLPTGHTVFGVHQEDVAELSLPARIKSKRPTGWSYRKWEEGFHVCALSLCLM